MTLRLARAAIRPAVRWAGLAVIPAVLALPLPAAHAAPPPRPPIGGPTLRIVAVVNGDAITQGDVNARRRLFAASVGLPMTQEVLDRLTPQVIRQLIDERLRLQEIQRRQIVVPDKDIADAIANIERRNNLPPGALRAKFSSDGISMRTLIDQIRVQLGWTAVLRQVLGDRIHVSDAEVAEQEALLKAEAGKPEYNIGEIFIPVESASGEADAQRFTETVISQLRAGAPFPVVAAQFSQSQSALEGGARGWVQPNEVDPAVAQVMTQMPVGAISNPIRVVGGFEIIQLRGQRTIGTEQATLLSLREAFFPFSAPLNPAAPTDQQRAQLEKARALSASAKSCDDVEAANKAAGSAKPSDPGQVTLESATPPAFRQLLASLPLGKASQPLVAPDGIMVVMVCSRTAGAVGLPDKKAIIERVVNDRAELASRQLLGELRRRASIEMRP